ncbi:hypothetical protein [Jannaschia donghaensis]|uniref:Asparagine synthase (Glutamine-hydrolyzing) n=1 Tax=Jannaschia donghaensis TaxID=420998 RepID=A0A0M6YGU9_9RHOB|nr:hypothetical protein [Jannaschia donghaensis]CTQ49009.1 hypothetical protein JDO7802_01017 [Jannaschia donghaensis]
MNHSQPREIPSRVARGEIAAVPLGARICSDEDLPYGETFLRQFVIDTRPVAVPSNWRHATLGARTLWHCPELPLMRLVDDAGEVVGLVLGIALIAGAGMVADGTRVPCTPDALERWIENVAGRYIVLTDNRLYVDPSCSLTPFFDPTTGRIAASVPLAIDRPLADSPDLPLSLFRAERGRYYFFGDTVDATVQRMMANHYLDLSQYRQVRHWPRDDTDFTQPASHSDQVDAICDRLTQVLEVLIGSNRCALPITGGQDSRFLLGCCHHRLSDLASLYCWVRNEATFVDALLAETIAERLQHPLLTISCAGPTAEAIGDADVERIARMIDLRSSFQYAPDARSIRAHQMAPPGDLILRGGLIELMRANKWRVAWGTQVTPELGLRALSMPTLQPDDFKARSEPRYGAWLDGLPEAAKTRAADLGHCEIWMPTTQSMISAGYANRTIVYGANDRELLRMIMCMTYPVRRGNRPQRQMERWRLPMLQGVPYRDRTLSKAVHGSGLFEKLGRATG